MPAMTMEYDVQGVSSGSDYKRGDTVIFEINKDLEIVSIQPKQRRQIQNTQIGVDHRGITERIRKLVPDYMVMGERGMADMTEMTMPLPDNTLPMMTGDGPYGSVEMGGMFSMLKVRSDLAPDDYSDPGWYKHPEGHQAYEYSGELPEVSERFTPGNSLMAPKSELASANFKAVKPNHRKSQPKNKKSTAV